VAVLDKPFDDCVAAELCNMHLEEKRVTTHDTKEYLSHGQGRLLGKQHFSETRNVMFFYISPSQNFPYTNTDDS
jgi:hypothetical protein